VIRCAAQSVKRTSARAAAQQGPRFDPADFDFYAANLQRKYGPEHLHYGAYGDRRCRLGFNLRQLERARIVARPELAYVVPIHIYGNFAKVSTARIGGKDADPFDPSLPWVGRPCCKRGGPTGRPLAHRYFVDNELPWGLARYNPGAVMAPWRR